MSSLLVGVEQGSIPPALKEEMIDEASYQEHGTDPRNYCVDLSKLRERLAFEPAFDVEWGITELVDALSKVFLSDYAERANYC